MYLTSKSDCVVPTRNLTTVSIVRVELGYVQAVSICRDGSTRAKDGLVVNT